MKTSVADFIREVPKRDEKAYYRDSMSRNVLRYSKGSGTSHLASPPAFALCCPMYIGCRPLRTHHRFLHSSSGGYGLSHGAGRSVTLCTVQPAHPGSPPIPHTNPAANQAHIIALHENWVAVNKPPSMLVHRTKLYHARPGEKYLVDEVRRALEEIHGLSVNVFPVQRLDRPTSGVMVFALGDSKQASLLQNALQSEKSRKEYWAIAFGAEMPKKWENSNTLRDLTGKVRKERSALSKFEQLLRLDESDISIVRATLATGRRHQIRRHLSYSHHPILGDTSYGKGPKNRFVRENFGVTRCCLHSRRIAFEDPDDGLPIALEAPVPQDLREVLAHIPEIGHHHNNILDLGNLEEDHR